MKKILIIDDQKDNLISIEAVIGINITNCKVLTALSGKQGIKLAKEEQPDTILLDIIMPEMDGYEVCKQLKEDLSTKHIPIILISAAKIDSKSRANGLISGADAFLSKPIDTDEFVAQIKVMLRIKETEDKLKGEKLSLENKYENLFETMEQGVVYQDAKGNITSANPAAEKILGLTLNQMMGRTSMHPDWRVVGEDGTALPGEQHAAMVALRTKKRVRDAVFGVYNPQLKDYVWILINSTPQFHKGSKEPYQVYSTFSDITDRKRAELEVIVAKEKAEESENYLNKIINNIGDPVFVKDDQSRFYLVNDAFCEFLSLSKDEIIGKTLSENLPADEMEHFFKVDKPVLKNGQENLCEELLTVKAGDTRTISTRKTRYIDIYGKKFLIGVIRDITEQKRSEELLRQSEATVRNKLKAITELEGDIGSLDLDDIIDSDALQSLMEQFYKVVPVASAIGNLSGKALAAVGWQDICTKFHRYHPETAMNCNESDTILAGSVPLGTFKAYRCKNNMWDMAAPIEIAGRHFGNIFIGQFFYTDEEPDINQFRQMALQYGFDEAEYLAALGRVPRLSRQVADAAMAFYSELAKLISNLSLSTFKLAKTLNEQKQTEVELIEAKENAEKSENYLNSIINNIGDPVFVKDDQSRILLTNDAFCSLFQLSRDQMIGKTLAEEVPPEEQESFLSIDKEVIETGKENINEESFSVIGKQPKIISTKKSRFIDNNGKKYLIGIIRDITERKLDEVELLKAKEKAEENETILKTAMENSQAGIAIAEVPSGKLTYVNKAGLLIRDKDYDDLVENIDINKYVSSWQILHLDGTPYKADEVPLARAVLYGETNSKEFLIRRDDNKDRHVWANAAPVINESGVQTHAIVLFLDVTDLKNVEKDLIIAKEKAEESDRLKSAFLANMSHEIRTPMNGILGFAELLKEPDLTGDQQIKFIDIIQKGGARMLNIINDIVDISKIESNLVKMSTSETDINKSIEYIHAFFKLEAQQKEIKLDYTAPLPTGEANVIIDREKIYAILTNLVKNAIKFTDKGSIELGYTKKDNYLEFYVKDTGIGIPNDRQGAIFERFIQSDIEDKHAYQGAGLGLAISKAYIEMMNGKIWVESEFGKGSTFYFTIPYIVKAIEKQNDKISITDVAAADVIKNLKVLLVEDDEVSMDFLKIIMDESHTLFAASNGAEAVNMCKDNSDLDLILMDIKMPIMDGFEATKEIRLFNKDVIIIAQTAYGLTGDRTKAIEAGCNDYISKPIVKNVLFSKIREYFTN